MLTWCVLLLLMASQVESFDSRDLLCHYGGNSLRPAVAKSYSFGGYTQATATQLQLTPTGDQDAIGVAPSAPVSGLALVPGPRAGVLLLESAPDGCSLGLDSLVEHGGALCPRGPVRRGESGGTGS